MEIVSRHPRMPSPSTQIPTNATQDQQELGESQSSADTHAWQLDQQFRELPDELLKVIIAKLPLREVVCLHFGSSQERRARFMSSRVFEGEPFFLRGNDPVFGEYLLRLFQGSSHWFYAYSMQKWLKLQFPFAVAFMYPVCASGGLVLFSRVLNRSPGELRTRPLEVVNPITREHRSLSLPPPEPPVDLNHDNVHLGFIVSAESNTYKVVVHWMDYYVVQIFDSGSGGWSTVQVPREYISYANSSNEIVFCRTVYELHGGVDRTSVFDIRHGQLVDPYRDGFRRGLAILAGDEEEDMFGYPTAIDSCFYVLGYNYDPLTFIRIHRRERSSVTWQLVTEVPLDILRRCLEVDDAEFQSDEFREEGTMEIHECGKHLLFTAAYEDVFCGMLYDLHKQEWTRHYIMDRHCSDNLESHGLFFQPQLYGPPC